jgi:hypothetical protein
LLEADVAAAIMTHVDHVDHVDADGQHRVTRYDLPVRVDTDFGRAGGHSPTAGSPAPAQQRRADTAQTPAVRSREPARP